MTKLVITLNDFEVDMAKELARVRSAKDRTVGANATAYNGRDQQEIDEDGFGAELAFCKAFNYYPDFSTDPRVGGCDCVSRNGQTIDVKQTPTIINPKTLEEYPGLLVKAVKSTDERYKVDYYVFLHGKLPTFTMEGYASYDEAIKSETIEPHGEGSKAFRIPLSVIRRENEKN